MTKEERALVKAVWSYYGSHARHELPWRKTTSAYKIAVSELMLQQTQVSRVIPKYQAFIKQFPSSKKLAEAQLSEVLLLWQGLGYNRRAKYLKLAAETVESDYHGTWPNKYQTLLRLPGIGPYTAGAIMAFAYNQPIAILETNIRTVFIHHLYPGVVGITDTVLLKHVAATLDSDKPRDWYAALMDYGSHLKSTVGNVSRQSSQYKKQTTFKTSNRYVRGTILKLVSQTPVTFSTLKKALPDFTDSVIRQQTAVLRSEGLLGKQGNFISLP